MNGQKARIGFSRNWARKVITTYGIGSPPVDLAAIAGGEGLQVKLMESWPSKVSGLLLRDACLIGINARHSRTRRRFSLAHELGHWFMRHDFPWHEREITIDQPPAPLDEEKYPIEKEANEFAGELLAPRAMLKLAVSTNGDPNALAAMFDMSSQAMWIQLMKHGLI